MSLSSQTDEELVKNYAAGDHEAFKQLYSRYSSRIYGYLRSRLVSETSVNEVFQEVFLKLHKQRHKFRADHSFKSWVFTISYSCLIDHLRKQKLDQNAAAEMNKMEIETAAKELPDSTSLGLGDEFEKLPPQQKQILLLRYSEDLDYSDIAKQLGLSPANVRQITSRAIKKLRTLLIRT